MNNFEKLRGMAKLIITGNTEPRVGNTEIYSLSAAGGLTLLNPVSFPLTKIRWNIHVQDKKGWRITNGNLKEGEMVSYTFTNKSLKYKALKIEVVRGKDRGDLYIRPQVAESPKIVSVELLDINSRRIPKGKLLHYTDTIIAKAYCVGMFGQKVSFSLWEDDATGKGHDPVVNMMNKINQIPVIGEVDHEGVARVVFRLSSYTMAVRIANMGVARGDKNEGKTHEYYVTAEKISKHILKTSPNVNVANPTYIPPASEQSSLPKHIPPGNKGSKQDRPKPKENTAKFPQTPEARQQADPEGKILSAEFTDGMGKPLKNAKTGNIVSIKITSQNMKGKNVKIRIWEEDLSCYSNDLLYEMSVTLAYDTTNFINGITLTREMYTKGNGWGEGPSQEYFIEVEHLNTSVTSRVIPISPDAEPVKVDPNDSPVMIKEPKREKKVEKASGCICQQYDLVWGNKIGCNERKKVIEVAKNLNIDPNWLMTVMALETIETFRPSIDNGVGYVGLIQFGKEAAKTIKITQDQLIKMSFIEQMEYVQKHLVSHKAKYKTLTDLYLAVLYPSACGHGSEKDYVVLHGAAYRNNPLFFKEKGEWEWAYKTNNKGKQIKYKKATDPDGNTYVWEVAAAAQEVYNRGLDIKENQFSCGVNKEEKSLNGKCAKDCSQCFEYADVVSNPKVNDQSGNKNHNRYHKAQRTRSDGSKYFHTGTDILSIVGTEVHSMMCGEIIHTRSELPQNDKVKGYESSTSYGNTVTIKSKDKDGKTVYTFYAHLSKINVKIGQKVKHNEIIGLSGSTGNAMHIEVQHRHIHVEAGTDYEIYSGGNKCKLKNRINPENYMKSKFDNKGNTL